MQSNDGKRVLDEAAPEAVVETPRGLGKAKRWRGLVVHAAPEGIAIRRQSKGTNIWLHDLWLAEHWLAEIHAVHEATLLWKEVKRAKRTGAHDSSALLM